MEYIEFKISSEIIHIPIERKQMKKVRLRIYPSGDVKISAPVGVSYEWINQYVNSKKEWINKKIAEFKQTNGVEAVDIISNGTTIKLFGKDYYSVIRESRERIINIDENTINIQAPKIMYQRAISSQIEFWLKNQLSQQINFYLDKLYPIIKKHGVRMPNFNIRKMKTLWGSCNAQKTHLTFNYYLYQAQPRLIEYVVLHELIHFIHKTHSKDFYSLLSLYMPDWQERKHYLDHEVMQGVHLI